MKTERSGQANNESQPLPSGLAARLLPWYAAHARPLPWRRSKEPYPVWVSEVMLQQTRAEAVIPYYTRFLDALPDLYALADASDDRLFKLWEGLGYYSRARNLRRAAQLICTQHSGVFPDTYEGIRALPGVGAYTAGAVGSICFDLPVPAADGNVFRVAARLTGDACPIDTAAFKNRVTGELAALYCALPADGVSRGAFTQSLMELGATVCTPRAPHCAACPLNTENHLPEMLDVQPADCAARRTGSTAQLPVKRAKKPKRIEEKTVWFLDCGGQIALRQRAAKGLLAGLWELPNCEGVYSAQDALHCAAAWGAAPMQITREMRRTHLFTHIEWRMTCYVMTCAKKADGFTWADAAAYPLPTAFRIFLEPDAE